MPIEPCIEDRLFIESNVDNIKNRYDKILKEPELVKLFNFKFEKFTVLQKLVAMWGLVNYGFAYGSVLAEVPNIFSLTKSIGYENDEILNFLNKTLEEFKVDSFISSFENIKYVNYDRRNNFCVKSFPAWKKSNNVNFIANKSSENNGEALCKFIYNLDPPMLNNTNWDFYYNKKIFQMQKIKQERKKLLNCTSKETGESKLRLREILNQPTKEILEDYPIVSVSEIDFDKGEKRSGINLILANPVFTLENKKMLFNAYKDFMKKLCEKVEGLFCETQSKIRKHCGGNY